MSETEKLPELEIGVHLNVPEETYHRLPYLNATVINAFQQSEMDAWKKGPWNWEPGDKDATDAMNFGNARHAMILEGMEKLLSEYCSRPHVDDYPGALRNMTEMKAWLKDRGVKGYSSLDKNGLIDLCMATDDNVEIAHVLVEKAMRENAGKTFLNPDHWQELVEQNKLFEGDYGVGRPGYPEVTIIWEMNGVRCKARIDWLGRERFEDVKNFNNKYKKPLEVAITQKLCYEGIYLQMTFYGMGIDALKDHPSFPEDIRYDHHRLCRLIFLQTDTPNYIPRLFDPYENGGLAELAHHQITEGMTSWEHWMSKGYEKPWNPKHAEQMIAIEHVPISFLG